MLPLTDLTHLHWEGIEAGKPTTTGSFLKAVADLPCGRVFYKLSLADIVLNKIIGYESFFEVIASRLCRELGIECVNYELIRAKILLPNNSECIETHLCASRDFRGNFKKETAEGLCLLLGKDGETALETLRRLGFSDFIDRLLLTDFLICNRDRHGKNLEFYTKNGATKPVPLFDNGFSFVAPYGNNLEIIEKFNPLRDMPVNNFLGSKSLEENLRLIQKNVVVNKPKNGFRTELFRDMEDLPSVVGNKAWEIFESRYFYAKDRKILVEGQ